MRGPHTLESRSERYRIEIVIDIELNGEPLSLVACSIADLLEIRGLSKGSVAVERNGMIVPRSKHTQTRIESGDRLEIVAAVGGG